MIQKTKYSYNLENRWAISLGNNMARIASKKNFLQILEERNTFSTRLYGIPKQTSTVILHQELKNLKTKTCFISKCSISGKNKSFTIISFEIQQELDKACTLSIRYQNAKLIWSKPNRQYETNQSETSFNTTRTRSPISETMGYPKTYIKDSKQNGTNRNKDIRALKKHPHKSNLIKEDLKGKGKAKMSIFTRISTIDDTMSWKRKREETSHRKLTSDIIDKL